jgi:hypothetical protein
VLLHDHSDVGSAEQTPAADELAGYDKVESDRGRHNSLARDVRLESTPPEGVAFLCRDLHALAPGDARLALTLQQRPCENGIEMNLDTGITKT